MSRNTRISVSRTVLAGALASTVFMACGPRGHDGHSKKAGDLAAENTFAEVHAEVDEIDFGTERSRAHLVSGWSWNERTDEGQTTLVWGRDEVSTLEIFLAATREIRVTFRCTPFTFRGAPGQGVTFELDGRPLAEVELDPGFHEYSVVFPEGSLAAGVNRLHLRYRYAKAPQEAGLSNDSRRLAVAWDWLRLEPVQSVDHNSPNVNQRDAAIFLPYGTEISYYFNVFGRSSLRFEAVEMEGSGTGGLALLAQEEGKEEHTLATIDRASGSRALSLPGHQSRLLRVALRAFASESQSGSSGGVLITRPEVWSEDPSKAVSVPRRQSKSANRPNIVIYVIDTLRADRLGTYGGSPHLSPEIDAFAEVAIVYDRAIAQSSWTKPAVASVLTGLPPTVHGTHFLESKLPAAAETLAEILRDVGYRTAGFSTNPNISSLYGFDQGFDEFLSFPQYTSSDEVSMEVKDWLATCNGQPFFLYVHTMDPHAPYDPPAAFRQRFAAEVRRTEAGTSEDIEKIYAAPRGEERRKLMVDLPPLYDAEVAFNDQSFGELIDVLDEMNLFDGALILFLSDHGEEFGEHGSLGHGHQLYSEVLRVPLMIKPPFSSAGQRVAAIAQHLDVLPTVLTYLGLVPAENLTGTDLLALAEHEVQSQLVDSNRTAFSYMDSYGVKGISVVQGRWKMVEPLKAAISSRPELYNHARDPGDQRNVLEEHPIRAGYLTSLTRRELARMDQALTAENTEIDEVTRQSLEALGYLGDRQSDQR